MKDNQNFVLGPHFANISKEHLTNDLIGGKALGLFEIPQELCPPFIILTGKLYSTWRFSPNKADQTLKEVLETTLSHFKSIGVESFIVRSSAENETFGERGFYNSSKGLISIEKLYDTIISTWKINSEYLREEESIALIIQQYITPKLIGHLSNERRISKNSYEWIAEIETQPKPIKFTASERSEIPTVRYKDARHLKKPLNEIASYWNTWNYKILTRHHLEWVGDGDRIWIVQNDNERIVDKGVDPGSEWKRHLNLITDAKQLQYLKTVKNSDTTLWKKMFCVDTFSKCSLPFGNVYIIDDKSLLEDLASGNVHEGLYSELDWLLATPIVIRMDVEENDNIMLPRTETLFTMDQAIAFLREKSGLFLSTQTKFCFLIHRFIVSKACALAYAKPTSKKVRIDSTWGIVDGLHYHPHDSYEIESGRKPQKKIRCKTEFLDVDQNGNWISRKSGNAWDWKESLNIDQLDSISKYTLKITEFLNKPVVVMYFVDVPNETGYEEIVPWFFSNDEIPESVDPNWKDGIFNLTNVLIRNKENFNNLKKRAEKETENRFFIKLRLDVDIIRSKTLIEEIGAFAREKRIPIELEGSLLSHTYYILRKQGANVKCVDVFTPKETTLVYNKLVRDLIPENIKAKGENVEYTPVPSGPRLFLLKKKSVEEALELFWERDHKKSIEELADLYEVIRSATKELGIDLAKLNEIADKKSLLKGGFEKGLLLRQTENLSLFGIRKKDESSSQDPQSTFFDTDSETPNSVIEHIPDGYRIPYINRRRLLFKAFGHNIQITYTPLGIVLRIYNLDQDPNQLRLF